MAEITGQGFTGRVENDKLILEIDLNAPRVPSASGKTKVIASTRGNIPIVADDGKVFSLGLNFYTKED